MAVIVVDATTALRNLRQSLPFAARLHLLVASRKVEGPFLPRHLSLKMLLKIHDEKVLFLLLF